MGEEETKGADQRKESQSAEREEKALVSLKKEDLEFSSKPLPIVENHTEDHGVENITGKSKDRDVALAKVELEKRLALIKAWEDNEKTKVDNKACKKLSAIDAWENTKKAYIDAQLKQIEEEFEKKKAEYGEKMKNKAAIIHKAAEEKRAVVEADRGKDVLRVEETAAKFRATGSLPKKSFACFTC